MIDTTPYDNIRFAFRSTTGGETIYLRALDPTNTQYGEVIINNYITGGTIAANTWYDIVVPLSDINAVNVDVRGLYIMSNVATTLYVDEWRIEEATGSGPASNTFGYDHNNLRVVKDAVVYPNGYYNTNTTSGVETLHIMSPDGTNVATVVDGVITYTHTDHLGGTNVVTDSTAGVTETIDYYPFGEQRISDLQSGTAEQRKFTGHEYDGDSDLTYARARYLDQDIGKFLSQDVVTQNIATDPRGVMVLVDPQLANSYSYVRNNPLNGVDADGEFATLVGGAQSGAIIGAPLGPAGSLIGGVIGGIIGGIIGIIVADEINDRINEAREESQTTPSDASKPAEKVDTPDVTDFEGKSPEEVDQIMKDKGFRGEPARDGGTRYPNPTRKGDQIRTSPGNPDTKDPNPVKKGPYIRGSKNGDKTDPIPLEGNPTL